MNENLKAGKISRIIVKSKLNFVCTFGGSVQSIHRMIVTCMLGTNICAPLSQLSKPSSILLEKIRNGMNLALISSHFEMSLPSRASLKTQTQSKHKQKIMLQSQQAPIRIITCGWAGFEVSFSLIPFHSPIKIILLSANEFWHWIQI